MRVGNDELPLLILAHKQTVVGGFEVMSAQQRKAVAVHAIETIGGQSQETVGSTDEREHIALRGNLHRSLPFLQAEDPLWCGHVESCRVEVHLAVGCHLVQ